MTLCSNVVSESETNNCIYGCLIKVALSAIAVMNGNLTAPSNLYQQHKLAVFIYLVSKICHEIAKRAPRPNTLTIVLFHASDKNKAKVELNGRANGKREGNSNDDKNQLSLDVKKLKLREDDGNTSNVNKAMTFTFDELTAATGNFR
ncbi:hypothetical protein PIB30_036614 [Stylosanthes scabra]|uniref:Uncharacterized protein n=1 Tax=Stylosanthes scabra TaxID=79078 RepID=A0ABU6RDV7_9FABA|nr:hypothetical protein [Stylosanthes scabra]